METKNKKYYWIKLKADFFSEDSPFDFLMAQENGGNYVALYLKLCLMTVNNGGKMSRQIGEMIVPYDIDKIVRDAKYFSHDTVRVAIELFSKLGLIYKDLDGILSIANYNELVGADSYDARRKKEYRERLKSKENGGFIEAKTGQDEDKCPGQKWDNVPQEIRDKSIEYRDKDIRDESTEYRDKELKKELIIAESSIATEEPFITLTLNDKSEYPFFRKDIDEYKKLYPAVDVEQQFRAMRGWCLNNPKKRKTKRGINTFVNNWLAREQDKFHPSSGRSYNDERIANRVQEVDNWSI